MDLCKHIGPGGMLCLLPKGHAGHHKGGRKKLDKTWPKEECGESPNERGFVCTLPKGHEGDHEAWGGVECCHQWPQEKNEETMAASSAAAVTAAQDAMRIAKETEAYRKKAMSMVFDPCDSTSRGHVCQKLKGHPGPHQAQTIFGKETWRDLLPAPPVAAEGELGDDGRIFSLANESRKLGGRDLPYTEEVLAWGLTGICCPGRSTKPIGAYPLNENTIELMFECLGCKRRLRFTMKAT